MPIPSNPDFLESVIGTSADVLPIPAQDYTDPTQNGALNYKTGWPAITALPLEAGGKAPRREYFNSLAQLLSSHVFFQQSGSLYTWSSTLNYLRGAHILGSDGKEYIAQQSNGPDVPDVGSKNPISDDGSYWKVYGNNEGGVLIGSIMAFSGTFGGTGNRFPVPLDGADPDTSWCLCDGTTTNGLPVPDLRGRMILGVSDAYPKGSKGGAATHTHALSGNVGATTLSVAQTAAHFHVQTSHGYYSLGGAATTQTAGAGGAVSDNRTTERTGASQSHTHALSGTSGQASSLPPYYALAYIMRVA